MVSTYFLSPKTNFTFRIAIRIWISSLVSVFSKLVSPKPNLQYSHKVHKWMGDRVVGRHTGASLKTQLIKWMKTKLECFHSIYRSMLPLSPTTNGCMQNVIQYLKHGVFQFYFNWEIIADRVWLKILLVIFNLLLEINK